MAVECRVSTSYKEWFEQLIQFLIAHDKDLAKIPASTIPPEINLTLYKPRNADAFNVSGSKKRNIGLVIFSVIIYGKDYCGTVYQAIDRIFAEEGKGFTPRETILDQDGKTINQPAILLSSADMESVVAKCAQMARVRANSENGTGNKPTSPTNSGRGASYLTLASAETKDAITLASSSQTASGSNTSDWSSSQGSTRGGVAAHSNNVVASPPTGAASSTGTRKKKQDLGEQVSGIPTYTPPRFDPIFNPRPPAEVPPPAFGPNSPEIVFIENSISLYVALQKAKEALEKISWRFPGNSQLRERKKLALEHTMKLVALGIYQHVSEKNLSSEFSRIVTKRQAALPAGELENLSEFCRSAQIIKPSISAKSNTNGDGIEVIESKNKEYTLLIHHANPNNPAEIIDDCITVPNQTNLLAQATTIMSSALFKEHERRYIDKAFGVEKTKTQATLEMAVQAMDTREKEAIAARAAQTTLPLKK